MLITNTVRSRITGPATGIEVLFVFAQDDAQGTEATSSDGGRRLRFWLAQTQSDGEGTFLCFTAQTILKEQIITA